MNTIDYSYVSRGTRGIFGEIEKDANRFSAKCLIMLAVLAALLVALASLVDKSEYMTEVRISMGVMVLICVSVGAYCLTNKKDKQYRKFILCFAWFISLILAVTFIDSSVSLLYAVPVLIAIRYNSIIFTLFVSLFDIIFAFFPYIINTYRGAFPLDFIVLEPGTTISVTGSSSLDGTVNALANGLMRNETIANMLTYGYLSTALLLVLISVIAVSCTAYNRKLVLDQYKKARNLLEENK